MTDSVTRQPARRNAPPPRGWTRREICAAATGAALAAIGATPPLVAQEAVATRPIPSSGEPLPLVGLGSWITFNVGDDPELLASSTEVIRAFFAAGGRLIDCSPMYGSSQTTIGHALAKLDYPRSLFSAEKVWTSSGGREQIEDTRTAWGVPKFSLIQVHNLVAWRDHIPMLNDMKAAGKLGYVGITTSHGLRHDEIEQIMTSAPVDFVQLTYNAVDRNAESRILPLAQERGVAVIVNRPFRQKQLIRRVERHPLPQWASDAGASSWPQFLLKFIISHPAVTCAIPATTRVDHVRENLACAGGILPDDNLRRRMAAHVAQL